MQYYLGIHVRMDLVYYLNLLRVVYMLQNSLPQCNQQQQPLTTFFLFNVADDVHNRTHFNCRDLSTGKTSVIFNPETGILQENHYFELQKSILAAT